MQINRVVRVLVTADIIYESGWGLIYPLYAVFILNNIHNSSIKDVGIAASIFLITKSFIQPFIARFLDNWKGEMDDFYSIIIGINIANLVPIGYIFATQMWQIYLLEVLRAFGIACIIPAWSGIITRHIDKGKEAFSWSLAGTGVGLGMGIAGATCGYMTDIFGFTTLFGLTSLLGFVASLLLFSVRKHLYVNQVY
jgi:MFS family permease